MREAGLKPSSVNCRLRAIAAYVKWAALNVTVPRLREEKRELPTFSADSLARLLKWKPRTPAQHRLSAVIALLFDSGCRIDECLSLQWSDIDFDNLLVTLHGKGRKDRKVPISLELRRRLYIWRKVAVNGINGGKEGGLVFPSRSGIKQGRRNVLRDVKALCKSLGFKPPERTLHATRHTFALNYLRRGGSVFHLQRLLGHTSLEMTRRYVNLTTQDLQEQHEARAWKELSLSTDF